MEEVREYGKKSQPKIRYSQFDAEDIRKELLERYGMEMPVECRLFDYGMNDIYRIKTKKETYFLRISLAGLHTKKDYEEEMHILNILIQNGIKAAAPVKMRGMPGRQEDYVWELHAPEGIRYAMLFTEAPNSPSDDKESSACNLGSMLAGIHNISDREKFQVVGGKTALEYQAFSGRQGTGFFFPERECRKTGRIYKGKTAGNCACLWILPW